MQRIFSVTTLVASLLATSALSQQVGITQDMADVKFTLNGTDIHVIERNQDPENRLDSEFAKTSRACPPFCISPMEAADGVETVGEIELINFIDSHVIAGSGLLVDSRIPEWFAKGTIPGAINIPFSTIEPDNPFRDDILVALGATQTGSGWDFSQALDMLVFCNGPWCDQAPQAIQNLVSVGYPAEKLRYYRGGMQVWQILGLTLASAE